MSTTSSRLEHRRSMRLRPSLEPVRESRFLEGSPPSKYPPLPNSPPPDRNISDKICKRDDKNDKNQDDDKNSPSKCIARVQAAQQLCRDQLYAIIREKSSDPDPNNQTYYDDKMAQIKEEMMSLVNDRRELEHDLHCVGLQDLYVPETSKDFVTKVHASIVKEIELDVRSDIPICRVGSAATSWSAYDIGDVSISSMRSLASNSSNLSMTSISDSPLHKIPDSSPLKSSNLLDSFMDSDFDRRNGLLDDDDDDDDGYEENENEASPIRPVRRIGSSMKIPPARILQSITNQEDTSKAGEKEKNTTEPEPQFQQAHQDREEVAPPLPSLHHPKPKHAPSTPPVLRKFKEKIEPSTRSPLGVLSTNKSTNTNSPNNTTSASKKTITTASPLVSKPVNYDSSNITTATATTPLKNANIKGITNNTKPSPNPFTSESVKKKRSSAAATTNYTKLALMNEAELKARSSSRVTRNNAKKNNTNNTNNSFQVSSPTPSRVGRI